MPFHISAVKDDEQVRSRAGTASEAEQVVADLLKHGARQVYIHDGDRSLTHEQLTRRANGLKSSPGSLTHVPVMSRAVQIAARFLHDTRKGWCAGLQQQEGQNHTARNVPRKWGLLLAGKAVTRCHNRERHGFGPEVNAVWAWSRGQRRVICPKLIETVRSFLGAQMSTLLELPAPASS